MGFLSSIRRDLKGGTKSYKSLNKERGNWIEQQMAAEGFKKESQSFESGGDSGGWYSQDVYTDPKAFQREKQLRNEWFNTLDPAKKTKAMKEFGLHSSDMDSVNKYGSMAAKTIIGAAAGGAANLAFGAANGAVNGVSAAEIAAAAGQPELGMVAQVGADGALLGEGVGTATGSSVGSTNPLYQLTGPNGASLTPTTPTSPYSLSGPGSVYGTGNGWGVGTLADAQLSTLSGSLGTGLEDMVKAASKAVEKVTTAPKPFNLFDPSTWGPAGVETLTKAGVPASLATALGKIPPNLLLSGVAGLATGIKANKDNNVSTPKVDNTPGKSLLNYGQMTATAGQPMPQAQQPMMASKYQNSGLGRFGPGLFNPAPYSPTIYNWGKP